MTPDLQATSSRALTGCASPARTANPLSPIPARWRRKPSRPSASSAKAIATSACSRSPRPIGCMAAGPRRGNCAATAAACSISATSRNCWRRSGRDCGIVSVIDGHPAALGWLGSVRGHRVEALGVETVWADRDDRRSLPAPRHGRQRHYRCGRKPHRRRTGAASQDGGVRGKWSPRSGRATMPDEPALTQGEGVVGDGGGGGRERGGGGGGGGGG